MVRAAGCLVACQRSGSQGLGIQGVLPVGVGRRWVGVVWLGWGAGVEKKARVGGGLGKLGGADEGLEMVMK